MHLSLDTCYSLNIALGGGGGAGNSPPPPGNMVKSGDIVGHQKRGDKEKNATRLEHRTGPDNKELSGFYS